jgi:hypothetical protein
MSICLCYHDEQNFLHERGVCYGTKEKEPCFCGGNPAKCDFYEEVREKYIHRCKEDCYWYKEEQDMGAYIPYCDCKNIFPIDPKDCENCDQYHSKYKKTNADRIRAMTDEELAEFIGRDPMHDICPNNCNEDPDRPCKVCVLNWLKEGISNEQFR